MPRHAGRLPATDLDRLTEPSVQCISGALNTNHHAR
jgi:hypothetical protein